MGRQRPLARTSNNCVAIIIIIINILIVVILCCLLKVAATCFVNRATADMGVMLGRRRRRGVCYLSSLGLRPTSLPLKGQRRFPSTVGVESPSQRGAEGLRGPG